MMKAPVTCIFFLAVVLAACNNAEKKNPSTDSNLSRTVVKSFSDSLNTDTFKVKLMGTAPKNMYLAFTINTYKGVQIYSIKIKASDLFKNYDATIDLDKKKNQIKFLNNEIDRFLDDENFLEPAITEQEQPDRNVPDKAFYKELKKSQLNGFIYRLGKEDKIYIGWSQKEKKVKPYYRCCN